MNVLYLLVPLALLLAGSGVAAFVWSVRDGQYDDVETPAIRILMEDDVSGPTSENDADTEKTPPASSR